MSKPVTLTLTPRQLELLKLSVDETCNDSDLIWGGPDDHRNTYEEYQRLLELLHDAEQTQVFTH